ncbi:hypothetical protein DPMN_086697 [Dreissena polymorpha]|uniref:Uncharacterized protein n=1 Tax=Dreissena polymorpha TaxID=45954 RepID=A0A9D4QUY2_DREPO|nr:hypothetical protein DPMN_086697 [Dreissena polymorpha]
MYQGRFSDPETSNPRTKSLKQRKLKEGVKTEDSSRLKSAVLNALVMVSIEGPDNEAVGLGRMVDAWHQEKPRETGFQRNPPKHIQDMAPDRQTKGRTDCKTDGQCQNNIPPPMAGDNKTEYPASEDIQ